MRITNNVSRIQAVAYRSLHALLLSKGRDTSFAARALVAGSPLFDPAWYAKAYPDVIGGEYRPIDHYLAHGARDGRDPGPLFNTRWYLDTYPDVKQEMFNPLIHYLQHGWKEGRRTSPLFDPLWYVRRYPEVAEAGVDPLMHFFSSGIQEGRQPNSFFLPEWYSAAYPHRKCGASEALSDYTSAGWREGCDPGPLFCNSWYLDNNLDVAMAGIEPLSHFLGYGKSEGRRSVVSYSTRDLAATSPLFDAAWYAKAYPDVAGGEYGLIDHYLAYGGREGRDPGPLFKSRWYLDTYPDVDHETFNPLLHYIMSGRKEGRRTSPLFDPLWYIHRYPDVAEAKLDPLAHFLSSGMQEGRQPSPFFLPEWYTAAHPHRKCSPAEAFSDYTSVGSREGCDPSPLFWVSWYLEKNVDVAEARVDALSHFLASGKSEGRKPGPVLDADWYLERYPDVAAAGVDPLDHFVSSGMTEGRAPNIYVSPAWYVVNHSQRGLEAAQAFLDYTSRGWRENCDPSPRFSVSKYLADHPDVAAADIEPLRHFLSKPHGRPEPSPATRVLLDMYRDAGQVSAATLTQLREDRNRSVNRFFAYQPMNIEINRDHSLRPAVSIIVPGLNRRWATGGPNTAYILGCQLAAEGLSVNFISLDAPPDPDIGPLKLHLEQISGIDVEQYDVRFLDASDRDAPFRVGYNDIFVATAWWTAHPASAAAALLRNKEIFYLIQDYESMFYGLSTTHALARQTYSLRHRPIINTKLLLDQLAEDRVGLYADEDFVSRAVFFEPGIDRNHFYVEKRKPGTPQTLLFYTRPTMADRNMFGLGVAALKAAVEAGAFEGGAWEFIGMGEKFDPIELRRDIVLRPAPWLDFKGYGELMRNADILLSLMMSPHPSYPPLEMAACRGIVVTNTYGVKTSSRLAKISNHIIGVSPTIEAVAEGLVLARMKSEGFVGDIVRHLELPVSWSEALGMVVPTLVSQFESLGVVALRREPTGAPKVDQAGARKWIAEAAQINPEILVGRASDYRPPTTVNCDVVSVVRSTDLSWVDFFADDLLLQDTARKVTWFVIAPSHEAKRQLEHRLSRYRDHARLRIEVLAGYPGADHALQTALEQVPTEYLALVREGTQLTTDALRVIAAFAEQSLMPSAIVVPMLTEWNDDRELLELYSESCAILGNPSDMLPVVSRKVAIEHGWLGAFAADMKASVILARQWYAHDIKPLDLVERIARAPRRPKRGPSASMQKNEAGIDAESASPNRSQTEWVGDYAATFAMSEDVETEWLRKQLADLPEQSWIRLDCGKIASIDQETLTFIGKLQKLSGVSLVGGCLQSGTEVVESAFWFGGASIGSHGPFNLETPAEVGAVSARCALVRVDLLHLALAELPATFGLSILGPWLGALAQERGLRVVLHPGVRAAVESGCDLGLRPSDSARFALRFGDLGGCRFGRPFRGAMDSKHQSSSNTGRPWFAYRDLLEARFSASRERLSDPARRAPFSILTTVYIRTDTNLFNVTAQAVRAQIRNPAEWIVLAHGPVPDELSSLLDTLEAENLIRLYREPVNLGIHGGLRFCLDQASQPYAICLDADDVLTEDAIEILDAARLRHPETQIFYTDEDLLIHDRPVHAFRRPDYDPVHLRAHSFIWHSILFSTDEARRLGAFTSGASEYAQDWDIILRFEFAGFHAYHVREIVYHWRQHDRSLSNSGQTFQGSLTSVQAALENIRKQGDHGDDMLVSRYPADMGMPDFYLERLPQSLPSISRFGIGSFGAEDRRLPVEERFELSYERGSTGTAQLLDFAQRATSELILLTGPTVRLWENSGLLQALRHFELCSDVICVGGVVSRPSGQVISGPSLRLSPTTFIDWLNESSLLYRGGEMLSRLKTQAVDAVSVDLLLAQRTALVEALRAAPAGLPLSSVGLWLGLHVSSRRQIVAYEPLFRALTRSTDELANNTARALGNTATALKAQGVLQDSNWSLRGAAGILRMRNVHER